MFRDRGGREGNSSAVRKNRHEAEAGMAGRRSSEAATARLTTKVTAAKKTNNKKPSRGGDATGKVGR